MIVSELFKLYKKDVFGLCYYLLKDGKSSEDIVMSTFEVALKHKDLTEINQPKYWLLGIAKNLCYNKIRSDKKEIDLKNQNIQDFFVESESIKIHEGRDQLLEKLLEELNSLKFEQSQCLNLFYIQGKSYEETAKTLNFDLKAVKSHIQNGKRKLRIVLDKEITKING